MFYYKCYCKEKTTTAKLLARGYSQEQVAFFKEEEEEYGYIELTEFIKEISASDKDVALKELVEFCCNPQYDKLVCNGWDYMTVTTFGPFIDQIGDLEDIDKDEFLKAVVDYQTNMGIGFCEDDENL